ncbi:MAG: class I SAM-dependent methyltransferase [Chloroflexi bacterium]|nr:class I SAM-dependent methyltransferase [Chloroflexota bacterium]MDA1228178.1 class I SAM-dependent methyltransferase [Chloroflexota bacterium]
MDSSQYDSWAAIYDSVYSYVREDIPFYIDEAEAAQGPVLELGCGTGRVTIPIANTGLPIVGLDFSKAMLDVAREKAKALGGLDNMTLVHGGMADFSIDDKFGLVIIPFRGFLSLLSVEEEIKTLANIKKHLTPGGKLVFNIFLPDIHMMAQDSDVPYHFRDVVDPDTGTRYVLWNQTSYDNYSQVMNIRTTVEQTDGDAIVVRKLYRDFQLRNIFRWEMHHLLVSCGYQVDDLFGDFSRSAFDDDSTEMVWVASVAN